MLIVCFHVFIFFFKQKTAYEMRISDWSSDVCSSDLEEARAPYPAFTASGCARWNASNSLHAASISTSRGKSSTGTSNRRALYKIGRASCRERVCQYV